MKRMLVVAAAVVLSLHTVCGQWQANGVPVCDTSANRGFYMLPQIAPDGEGGAYVVWRDACNGDYDVYGQRIGPNGEMLWPRNGIPIVRAPNTQKFPRILGDAGGGAFIAWEDSRSDTSTYVYAQRINPRGESLWEAGGVRIAETPGLFISLAEEAGCWWPGMQFLASKQVRESLTVSLCSVWIVWENAYGQTAALK
jgi:hypothetical protein